MKRLFAAVHITPDNLFLRSYNELKIRLRPEPIKWVEEHNIHVTLKFFGETPEGKIPGIAAVLSEIASDTPDLNFCLSGLGIFGSSYQPRVIWSGIKPPDELAGLMKLAQQKLTSPGFEPDRQNIVPHFTMGRIKYLKDKQYFRKIIEEYKGMHSSGLVIRECILFESILGREGPRYISIGKFPFAGSGLSGPTGK